MRPPQQARQVGPLQRPFLHGERGTANPETNVFGLALSAKDIKNRRLWYYGKVWNKNEVETSNEFEVLVIGQIESNKIEFLITSKNPEFLVSLATIISTDLERRILSTGIIKSKDQIHDLECKNCGLALSSFPAKGESIECENCNYDQIVW